LRISTGFALFLINIHSPGNALQNSGLSLCVQVQECQRLQRATMAYEHYRRVFVVADSPRLSGVLAVASAKYEAAICRFSDCRSCLGRLIDTACDVLIVDVDEAGREALNLIIQAKRMWPWQSCIALVGRGAVERAVTIMKAGATDCLEKSAGPDPLLLAVERGLRRAAALFPSGTSLTETQLAVLHLMLAGKTSRDIAARLGRSKRTVDVHRRNVFRKLGLHSSLEMMKWAMSTGIYSCEWNEPVPACSGDEPDDHSMARGR